MGKNELLKILRQENIELGKLITDLREKAGILQKDLYEGLCSKEVYSRVEHGDGVPNELLAERILSRLHLQYRLLDMMINEEDFWLKECRYQIERCVDKREYDEARKLMNAYRRRVKADQPLQKQYLLWKMAQMEQSISLDSAGRLYLEALELTMPVEEFEKRLRTTKAISEEELRMYLGYRRCLKPFSIEEYEQMLAWMEENIIQRQVYPSCYFETGFFYAETLYRCGAYTECRMLCEKMLHWHIKSGKHFYLSEFHLLRAKVRMQLGPSEEEMQDIRQECKMAYYTALTFGDENAAQKIETYCREEFRWHIIG